MVKLYKYKRTPHLPFSVGINKDDEILQLLQPFENKTVAITIKMDGENTSMYKDAIHSRSLDSKNHPSRNWIKNFHSSIKYLIPENWRICGENMFAKHSIHYEALESYFYVFNVWNEFNECLSLADTLYFCKELNLTHVPTLGTYKIKGHKDWYGVKDEFENIIKSGEEGIVIRNINSFKYEDFDKNVAKAVRKNHNQSDENWSKNWIQNKLKVGISP